MTAARELMPTRSGFIPADRAHAMATGRTLPERQQGIVLFADIGGFTHSPNRWRRRSARNMVPGSSRPGSTGSRAPLAEAVARHHGSIVAFAGDAITCWFNGDHRLGAVAAALEMQAAMSMAGEAPITAVAGTALPTLKVALAREARVA